MGKLTSLLKKKKSKGDDLSGQLTVGSTMTGSSVSVETSGIPAAPFVPVPVVAPLSLSIPTTEMTTTTELQPPFSLMDDIMDELAGTTPDTPQPSNSSDFSGKSHKSAHLLLFLSERGLVHDNYSRVNVYDVEGKRQMNEGLRDMRPTRTNNGKKDVLLSEPNAYSRIRRAWSSSCCLPFWLHDPGFYVYPYTPCIQDGLPSFMIFCPARPSAFPYLPFFCTSFSFPPLFPRESLFTLLAMHSECTLDKVRDQPLLERHDEAQMPPLTLSVHSSPPFYTFVPIPPFPFTPSSLPFYHIHFTSLPKTISIYHQQQPLLIHTTQPRKHIHNIHAYRTTNRGSCFLYLTT